MLLDNKIKSELESRFNFVHSDVYEFNYPETLEFILTALDYFNLSAKGFAFHANKSDGNSNVCIGTESCCLEISNLQFSQQLTIEEMEFIALHEIQHVWQYEVGDLKIKNNAIYYKGRRCDFQETEYFNLPWEKDANIAVYDCPLFNRSLINTSEVVYSIFKNYDFALELFETKAA